MGGHAGLSLEEKRLRRQHIAALVRNGATVPHVAELYGITKQHVYDSCKEFGVQTPRKTKGGCSFPGCERPHAAKGLCNSHWAQLSRRGELKPLYTEETEEERWERLVDKTSHPGGCWIFTGNGNGMGPTAGKESDTGYGQFWWQGKKWTAHRYSYEKYVGPIPKGAYLDHMCMTKLCVNPDHLEPVTPHENIRRFHAFANLAARIAQLEDFVRSLGYDPKEIGNSDFSTVRPLQQMRVRSRQQKARETTHRVQTNTTSA
jgi:hypothetical protein